MSDKPNNLMAFVIGAAIGAVAGVLFAPDSGANTRKKLKLRMSELREKGSEALDEVEERIRTKGQHLRTEAEHQVAAVKSAVNEGKAAYIREVGKH